MPVRDYVWECLNCNRVFGTPEIEYKGGEEYKIEMCPYCSSDDIVPPMDNLPLE